MCEACGLRLAGSSWQAAHRFQNKIYSDLHYADVTGLSSGEEVAGQAQRIQTRVAGLHRGEAKELHHGHLSVPVQGEEAEEGGGERGGRGEERFASDIDQLALDLSVDYAEYIHEFKPKSRPRSLASYDGQIFSDGITVSTGLSGATASVNESSAARRDPLTEMNYALLAPLCGDVFEREPSKGFKLGFA
ncbi:hypothetical protein MTO96_008505 [Rhipicephalus appendiculatus]